MIATEWQCMHCRCIWVGKQPPRCCPDCESTDAWQKIGCTDVRECTTCGYLFVLEGQQPPSRCPGCETVGDWERVDYVLV